MEPFAPSPDSSIHHTSIRKEPFTLMAIILEAAYSKKLGLPNYSSHSYVVSIRAELSDLTQVEAESARLYALLQQCVDDEIQQVGFLPEATTYGMNHADNNHPNGNGHGEPPRDEPPVHAQPPADAWTCSDKQKELILKLVDQHGLDKKEVEALAKEMFELPVKALNRLQASGLIEELLARYGKARKNGRTNGSHTGAASYRRHARGMNTLIEPPPPAAPPTEAQIIDRLQESVSPSRLALFQSCRLKFFFRHVLRLQKPKPAVLHVGVSVHAVLHAWNRARWQGQVPTLGSMYAAYEDAWSTAQADEPVAWEDPVRKPNRRRSAGGSWKRSSARPPFGAADKPDGVEVSVEADLSPHGLPRLVGVLDLVQAGRIIDFKTTGQTPTPERTALVHGTQATAYAILYRQNTGLEKSGIELHHLVKLKQPRLVVIAMPPVREREYNRLLRVIDAYVEALERRDFIPSPGFSVRQLRVRPRMRCLAILESHLLSAFHPLAASASLAAWCRLAFVHRQQLAPAASQRLLEAQHRRDQNVDLASLDLLQSADVQVGQFSQSFLRHLPAHAYPAHARTQRLQLRQAGRVTTCRRGG